MIHLRDWILTNFLLELEPGNAIDFVYFKCNSSIPPAIYKISADVPWKFLKQLILRFTHQPSNKGEIQIDNEVILTIRQLLDLELWEKLYYIVGKYFILFFFLECTIFFKWGLNTFIILSDFKHDLKHADTRSSKFNNETVPLLLEGIGFDANTPLKIHKIMYNLHFMKGSDSLIPKISLQELKLVILNQSVNQELPGENIFTKKKMKLLKKMLLSNPTVKECERILLSTIPNKNLISAHYVSIFVTKVIKKYVPNNIFEYKKYFIKYLGNIQQLLKLNLNQKVNLGFLMKGILPKGDLWQRNVASKLALWLLNVFVMKLIQQFFYVTEVAKGNSLLFIRKHFWLRYQKEALQDMIVTRKLIQVEELENKSLLKELRFLPKATASGYRPLIRKSTFDKENKTKLEICNIFLKQLIATRYGKYPKHCNDLHTAWINFTKVKKRNSAFYYVKTDIMDAYGSIRHEKLKTLIQSLCHDIPERLWLVNFGCKDKWGKLQILSHFINLQPVIGNKMVTYNRDTLQVFMLSDIQNIIFQYIENIFVSQQSSKKCYKLISGLHQGGSLSAALCELYYSALDDEHLSRFGTADGDFLLRAVDDYLLISQNKGNINSFLEMMLNGFPEYGMRVQIEKTISNLESNFLEKENINTAPIVEFFGFFLDVELGVITPNMTKYEGINLRSFIPFKNLHERVLEQKMSSAMSLKLQRLLLDSLYQPKKVLCFNIHTASCFLALKFTAIVHFLHIAEVKLNEAYLKFCIMRGISAIASHCAKKGKPLVHFYTAKKICLRAFILILRKKCCFKQIVHFLMKKESSVKIRSKKTLRAIKSCTKIVHPSLQMLADAI